MVTTVSPSGASGRAGAGAARVRGSPAARSALHATRRGRPAGPAGGGRVEAERPGPVAGRPLVLERVVEKEPPAEVVHPLQALVADGVVDDDLVGPPEAGLGGPGHREARPQHRARGAVGAEPDVAERADLAVPPQG